MFFRNPNIIQFLGPDFDKENIKEALGPGFCALLERKLTEKLADEPNATLKKVIQDIVREMIDIKLKKIEEQLKDSLEPIEKSAIENNKFSLLKNAVILLRVIGDRQGYLTLNAKLHKSPYYSDVVKGAFIPGSFQKKLRQHTKVSSSLSSTTAMIQQWKTIADLALAQKQRTILGVVPSKKKSDIEVNAQMLSPHKKREYSIEVVDGKLIKENKLFDTRQYTSHKKLGFAAFVMDANGEMSAFKHTHGGDTLFHSSMNAGKVVLFPGEIRVNEGKVEAITEYSGHYEPSIHNLSAVLTILQQKGIDLSNTKVLLMNKLILPPSISLTHTKETFAIEQNSAKKEQHWHCYHAAELLQQQAAIEKYQFMAAIASVLPKNFNSADNLPDDVQGQDHDLLLSLQQIYSELKRLNAINENQIDQISSMMFTIITHRKNILLAQLQELQNLSIEDDNLDKFLKGFALIKPDPNPYRLYQELQKLIRLEIDVADMRNNYIPEELAIINEMRTLLLNLLNEMQSSFLSYVESKEIKSSNDSLRVNLVSNFQRNMNYEITQKEISTANTSSKILEIFNKIDLVYALFVDDAKQKKIGKYKKGNLSILIKEFQNKLQTTATSLKQLSKSCEVSTVVQSSSSLSALSRRNS